MEGTDAIRFCGECKKNVYHLSYMSNEQVEQLLARAGDPPCVRFYQRADGSVLLGDCPVGTQKSRRKRFAIGAVAAGTAMVLSAAGAAMYARGTKTKTEPKKPEPCEVIMGGVEAPTRPAELMGKVSAKPEPPVLMGDVDPSSIPERVRPRMGRAKRLDHPLPKKPAK